MLKTRVIPCLLLRGRGLVKTVRFEDPTYVGDPVNAVRIFNDREADELVLLDIEATPLERAPDFGYIGQIISECFMPVAYGGGLRCVEDVRTLLALGAEKAVINTRAAEDPGFIREAARAVGSQSIVVSVDVRQNLLGRYEVCTAGGRKRIHRPPADYARQMEDLGAGEILLNAIDRDGTGLGGDLGLIRRVTQAVSIPVVACGGLGDLQAMRDAVEKGGASAVAAGSMFVFHGRHRAVLISYPSREELERALL